MQSDIDIISCFHEFVREPWCALPDTFLGSHLGLVYLLPNAPERHESASIYFNNDYEAHAPKNAKQCSDCSLG